MNNIATLGHIEITWGSAIVLQILGFAYTVKAKKISCLFSIVALLSAIYPFAKSLHAMPPLLPVIWVVAGFVVILLAMVGNNKETPVSDMFTVAFGGAVLMAVGLKFLEPSFNVLGIVTTISLVATWILMLAALVTFGTFKKRRSAHKIQ